VLSESAFKKPLKNHYSVKEWKKNVHQRYLIFKAILDQPKWKEI
jgi:hypothetical protein